MSITLILANIAPLALGLGALAAISWFMDGLMGETYRPSKAVEEAEGEKTETVSWRRGIVRLIGLLGIPFGILCLTSLVSLIYTPGHPFRDILTLILLAWATIALFLTPISKLPWAALLGVAAGVIAAIAVTMAAPVAGFILPEIIVEYVSLKWILIAVFLIVGILTFSLFKWAENLLQLATTILGSRPMLLILAFIGFAQAIALLIVFFLFGGTGGILWFFIF